jgi:hypothetical protein
MDSNIIMEPTGYNYMALKKLVYNIDDCLNTNTCKIKINAFEINNSIHGYYLKYILIKNPLDVLFFPELEVIYSSELTSNKIAIMAQIQLAKLIQTNRSIVHEKYNKHLLFKGFYLNEDDIHIFFEVNAAILPIDCLYKKDQLWCCLIDEIMNGNKVCGFNIDISVVYFFTNNHDFCFLQNINNENYELPMVGYIGSHCNKLNFTYTFGISVKDKCAILGPYYYFTDYEGSIKYIIENQYTQGGIIRFALFLGKTKIIENLLEDDNDQSELKRERLIDTQLDQTMEVLTMKISDHDGKWSEYYDSAFLGKIELDNGFYLQHSSMIVVKDYYQQIPLSYHHIDQSVLSKKYSENIDYTIM